MFNRRKHIPNTILGLILVWINTSALAFEVGEFQPPNLTGYTLETVKQLDKDEKLDGVKETTLEIYKNPMGKKIGKYITNDKTWAWGRVNNPMDRNDNVNNYAIRDSTGSGRFDEKYPGDEDFYLPRWVKDAR